MTVVGNACSDVGNLVHDCTSAPFKSRSKRTKLLQKVQKLFFERVIPSAFYLAACFGLPFKFSTSCIIVLGAALLESLTLPGKRDAGRRFVRFVDVALGLFAIPAIVAISKGTALRSAEDFVFVSSRLAPLSLWAWATLT